MTAIVKHTIRSIAVIGPSADDPDTLLGNYNGTPSSVVTPLAGIEQEFGGKTNVRYSLGATFTEQSDALVPTNVLTNQTNKRPPRANGYCSGGLGCDASAADRQLET